LHENIIEKNENLPEIKLSYLKVPLNILNNSHTIQINTPKGNKINIDKNEYELLQFHFHTPSEHALQGKRTPLEVHFVNKNSDGNLAVLGVFFKLGKRNKELTAMFNHLPSSGETKKVSREKINLSKLFPKSKNYYTYSGSLTTPPCSEIVTWYVYKDNIEISQDQLKKFKKLFKMNARPLQKVSSRIVEEKG
jgi:carbonic anhydrase